MQQSSRCGVVYRNRPSIHFSDFFTAVTEAYKYKTDTRVDSYSIWQRSIKDIEIKYKEDKHGPDVEVFDLQYHKDDGFDILFGTGLSVDLKSKCITNGSFTSGKFEMYLKDDNTLYMEFHGKSGMPDLVTAEYTRKE